MHLPSFLVSVAGLVSLSQAADIDRPAIKDSTILRSTTGCPACPEQDCYQCTKGHEDTLEASTGARALVRTLIGFELPVSADKVEKCTVQTPAFTKLPQSPITLTVSAAKSSDWDEDTVSGDTAPESGVIFNTVEVPALSNPPPIDVTTACKAASEDGEFSVYLGTESGSFAIWSKDSGNPAVLHVTYNE